MNEEEQEFLELCKTLLLTGIYPEDQIEEVAHMILDAKSDA